MATATPSRWRWRQRARHGGVDLRYRGRWPRLRRRCLRSWAACSCAVANSRGTGVGLYLVRVLMDRMGGSVEFGNAPGGGFAVTLHFRASA